MTFWHKWLESFFLQGLHWILRRDPSSVSPVTEREAALLRLMEESRAELERWKAGDAARGEVFQKLRRRLDVLKRERMEEKKLLREAKRDLILHERETAALKMVLAECEASGTANLSRPGLASIVPPDAEMERQRREFIRLAGRVWKYPMRIGVLRQHGPRPARTEKFPQRKEPAVWPKISVVTPSFNHAEFLDRTMQSVLTQDYPRLEYFVADGGSNDGSVEIIRKSESRLAGWVSEKDRGPAHAVNKGFAGTSGEIMAWLNSDDVWLPGVLRFVAAWFAAHPDVDVVYGHRINIDERDHELGHWTLPRHDGEMLLWGDYIPQETLFWRRSLWEKTGSALNESFSFAFDWELLLRFQRAGARMVRLPWFMGCFRVHAAQKSSAEISTTGLQEMERLRERELGDNASQEMAQARRVISFQNRAAWCDRLLRWGVRW